MCAWKSTRRIQLPLGCLSALLGLSVVIAPIHQALAAGQCAVGEGGALGVDNLGPVHIGDTITVTTVQLANLTTSFQATNFNTFVVFPNNVPQQVMHVNQITAGTACQTGGAIFSEICPGSVNSQVTCVPFVNTYTVNFADVGSTGGPPRPPPPPSPIDAISSPAFWCACEMSVSGEEPRDQGTSPISFISTSL